MTIIPAEPGYFAIFKNDDELEISQCPIIAWGFSGGRYAQGLEIGDGVVEETENFFGYLLPNGCVLDSMGTTHDSFTKAQEAHQRIKSILASAAK